MTQSPVMHSTLYASIGAEFGWYRVDVDGATVAKEGAIQLPGNVQYAWPDPSHTYLYVATTQPRATGALAQLQALKIEPGSGALTPHGAPMPMALSAMHMSVDAAGTYLFAVNSRPGRVMVHRIEADGTVGPEVPQPNDLDIGTFPHQVRMTPSRQSVLVVARGYHPSEGRPEVPGALKVFDAKDGVLTNRVSIAPNGGYGFGVRHLDFHPTKPWVYVSVERENHLLMFDMTAGDALLSAPRFTKDTLIKPPESGVPQGTGAIHVHPSGRFVYVSNRSDGGGEDNIAAFAIDDATGEPTLIQHADAHSLHARTFSIDPSGRLLVAVSIRAYEVHAGGGSRTIPGGITTFRIGDDGRLQFAQKYDVDTGDRLMNWSGMVEHL